MLTYAQKQRAKKKFQEEQIRLALVSGTPSRYSHSFSDDDVIFLAWLAINESTIVRESSYEDNSRDSGSCSSSDSYYDNSSSDSCSSSD